MKKLLAGSAVLALCIVPLATYADNHGDKGGHGKGQHEGGHHKGKGGHKGHHGAKHGKHAKHDRKKAQIRMMEMLETYDADGDGDITQAEVDQFRTDRLKTFDTDGNGTLSLAEYEALWLDAMREDMVRAFQHHDRDGTGTVTVEEFSHRTRHMVLRRDRNEDGVLNMDDTQRHMRRHGGPGKGKGKSE